MNRNGTLKVLEFIYFVHEHKLDLTLIDRLHAIDVSVHQFCITKVIIFDLCLKLCYVGSLNLLELSLESPSKVLIYKV